MGEYVNQIDGVVLTPLKIIPNPKGDILHALKQSDSSFNEFGEVYFSFIHRDEIKGWKKHTKMTLNIVVPIGEIQFFVYDDREQSETKGKMFNVKLSKNNYQRLSLSPGLWMAFKGLESDNMLMNFADIEHDSEESINAELTAFDWN
ncbi:MAG: dTDP-4-dehydrorhamnose 3,5-epimerase family protein [Bacteroidota bacterium]